MAAIYSCFIFQANQDIVKETENTKTGGRIVTQEYFEIRMYNY